MRGICASWDLSVVPCRQDPCLVGQVRGWQPCASSTCCQHLCIHCASHTCVGLWDCIGHGGRVF